MNQRIIYQTENGGVAVIIPSPFCGLTIEEIAFKDVPAGKAFKIIDVNDIPTDRAERYLWTVDESGLTDGIVADYDTFPEE